MTGTGPLRQGWPHHQAVCCVIAVAALLAGLAFWALRPAAATGSAGSGVQQVLPPLRVAAEPDATPRPQAAQAHGASSTPAAAPVHPASRSPAAEAPQPPYRFLGRSMAGTASQIVLHGQGRVVSLDGPGPLDDEFAVEAVFDDYLVLRHRRTGAGSFLPLERRARAVEVPADPEQSPRD